jgi:hypothetical protein
MLEGPAFLNRYPSFSNRGRTGSANITLPAMTSSRRSRRSASSGTNPTIDARIQELEDNLELVNDRVSQTQNEMDQEFRKQADAPLREQQIRPDEDQHIRAKTESTTTGCLHISAMGARWLTVETIMSSIPCGLAVWLK